MCQEHLVQLHYQILQHYNHHEMYQVQLHYQIIQQSKKKETIEHKPPPPRPPPPQNTNHSYHNLLYEASVDKLKNRFIEERAENFNNVCHA